MKEDKWMDCWCVDRREGEERKSKKEIGKEEEGRSKYVMEGLQTILLQSKQTGHRVSLS